MLFQILDNLHIDEERRFWIGDHVAEVGIGDMGEEQGQMEFELKIAFDKCRGVIKMKGCT